MWYLHILCARNVPQSISCLSGSGVQCRPGSELGRAAIIIRKDLLKLCKPTFIRDCETTLFPIFTLWFHFGIFAKSRTFELYNTLLETHSHIRRGSKSKLCSNTYSAYYNPTPNPTQHRRRVTWTLRWDGVRNMRLDLLKVKSYTLNLRHGGQYSYYYALIQRGTGEKKQKITTKTNNFNNKRWERQITCKGWNQFCMESHF